MSTLAYEIIGTVVLVMVNAFFVVAEFAIVKVRDTRIAELAANGKRRAKVADHIVNHLDAYLSATQLGVTVASLGLGWLGAGAFTKLFDLAINRTASAIIAFAFVTFITIIFGECYPHLVKCFLTVKRKPLENKNQDSRLASDHAWNTPALYYFSCILKYFSIR